MADSNVGILEDVDIKIKEPSKYVALLHNDDSTPIDLVFLVLLHVFNKTQDEAWGLTMAAHEQGKAVIMKSSFEVVEELAKEAMKLARQYGFNDFTITVEEE